MHVSFAKYFIIKMDHILKTLAEDYSDDDAPREHRDFKSSEGVYLDYRACLAKYASHELFAKKEGYRKRVANALIELSAMIIRQEIGRLEVLQHEFRDLFFRLNGWVSESPNCTCHEQKQEEREKRKGQKFGPSIKNILPICAILI